MPEAPRTMRQPDVVVVISGFRLLVDTSVALLALAILGPSTLVKDKLPATDQLRGNASACTESSHVLQLPTGNTAQHYTCGRCLVEYNCSVCRQGGVDCTCFTAQRLRSKYGLGQLGPGDTARCGELRTNDARLKATAGMVGVATPTQSAPHVEQEMADW